MNDEHNSLLDDDNDLSSLKPPAKNNEVIIINDDDNGINNFNPTVSRRRKLGDRQKNAICIHEIDIRSAVASMPHHRTNTIAGTEENVIDLLEDKEEDCILLSDHSQGKNTKTDSSLVEKKLQHSELYLKPKAKTKSAKETFFEKLQERTQELYPNMDESFMKEKILNKYDKSYTNLLMQQSNIYTEEDCIASILQLIASSEEANNYPKKQKQQPIQIHENNSLRTVTNTLDPPTCLYDYNNPSSDFLLSQTYRKECYYFLQLEFPFLSCSGIKQILAKCQGRYTLAFNYIRQKLQTTFNTDGRTGQKGKEVDDSEKVLNVLERAMTGQRLNPSYLNGFPRMYVLAKPRKKNVSDRNIFHITDRILADEVRYYNYKLEEWKQNLQKKIDRKNARRISEQNGTTLECQCCFADVAFEEMISCQDEGHLFCVDCIQRYAEEQVFGGNHNATAGASSLLTCMHGDGCKSQFSYEQLKNTLCPKVLTKYNELQTTLAIEKAYSSDDLCKCPKCDFQALLPSTEMIFRCPIASCGYESCRKCGEPPHIPLRCEEVEKKCETDGRKIVEEAMTNALIRRCPRPNCKSKFLKESGCNKMTCKCGAWVCYVCQKEVPKTVGYKHFCQAPHCSHRRCNKCPLYDKPERERDEMNTIREAGLKAAEEVRKRSIFNMEESLINANKRFNTNLKNPKKEVIVDVDALLTKSNGRISQKRMRF